MLSEISFCGRGGRAHFQHALMDKPKQLTINAPPAVDEEVNKTKCGDKKNELPLNKAIGNIHKYFINLYQYLVSDFNVKGFKI